MGNLLLLSLFLAITVTVRSDSSIVSELISSQFSGFVKLLDQANLLEQLEVAAKEYGNLTIFPVTDNYFLNKASPVLLSWLQKEENLPVLRRVLLNHVVIGHVDSHQLHARESLSGQKLKFTIEKGIFHVQDIPIRHTDILTTYDGKAHAIERLIIPEEVKLQMSSFLNHISGTNQEKSELHRSEKFFFEAIKVGEPTVSPILPSTSIPPSGSPTVAPSGSPIASPPGSSTISPIVSPTESPSILPSTGTSPPIGIPPGSTLPPSEIPSTTPSPPSPSSPLAPGTPIPSPPSSASTFVIGCHLILGSFFAYLMLIL